jgi:CRP/FNR family transcriptional regulator, cyclic AMP receptor protein
VFRFADRPSPRGDLDAAGMWQEQLGTGIDHVHIGERDFVFRAGQNPKIALLRAGVVRVFIASPSGRQLTIQYARVGDLIGVATYLAGSDDWNAEAITDVDAIVLSIDDLNRAAAQNPELPWRMAEHMARWTTEAMRRLADDAGQPMAARVARHLREVSLRGPDGRLVAHINQQRLANAVGTAREVVSRELKVLRTFDMIDTTSGSVTVLDEGRLARIAAGRSSGP